MTLQQLSKIWTVISLFLMYYALNTYLFVQGGIAIFGAALIVNSKTPAAMLGIPICSLLLIFSGLIGIHYARKQDGGWADRIPVVGFESINTKATDAKIYQGVVLTVFSLVPLLSMGHFWRVILSAKFVTTDSVPTVFDNIWTWGPTFKSLNDPARICTTLRQQGAETLCDGNITILPGLEPVLFAVLTAIAFGVLVSVWFTVFRKQPATSAENDY